MTCPDCQRDYESLRCVCGYTAPSNWTQGLFDPPQVRSTYQPLPTGMTCEAFGVDLFAAIKLIGGMSGLQEQIALAIHKGEGWKVQRLRTRRTSLEHELRGVLDRLPLESCERIYDQYPWIEALRKVPL